MIQLPIKEMPSDYVIQMSTTLKTSERIFADQELMSLLVNDKIKSIYEYSKSLHT